MALPNRQPEQAKVFTISRTFDAPRDKVWKAWADPAQVKQWFGPKGCTIPRLEVDFRAGGASRYTMDFEGARMHGQWAYEEIKAPEKIVAVVSFLDESWSKKIPHPASPNWPVEMYSVVEFHEKDNKTEIVVHWQPQNASPKEQETFNENFGSMEQGWGGSFDQLAEFLASQK